MIITKKYAKQLIRKGTATETGKVHLNGKGYSGDVYMAINRQDKQRIDHYFVETT